MFIDEITGPYADFKETYKELKWYTQNEHFKDLRLLVDCLWVTPSKRPQMLLRTLGELFVDAGFEVLNLEVNMRNSSEIVEKCSLDDDDVSFFLGDILAASLQNFPSGYKVESYDDLTTAVRRARVESSNHGILVVVGKINENTGNFIPSEDVTERDERIRILQDGFSEADMLKLKEAGIWSIEEKLCIEHLQVEQNVLVVHWNRIIGFEWSTIIIWGNRFENASPFVRFCDMATRCKVNLKLIHTI